MMRGPPRQYAILAGGLGTRLGGLVQETPKPMLDVGGRPFLGWLLAEAMRWGAEEFVLLTGHMSDHIEAALEVLARDLPRPAAIRLSVEPVRAGTGGALYHARHVLDECFVLMNGDSLLLADLGPALARFMRDDETVACRMLLRPVENAARYGTAVLHGDQVTHFHERTLPGASALINGGVYLMTYRVAAAAGPACSLERDLLPWFVARDAVRGTIVDGWFIDIGVPQDLARAQTELPRQVALARRNFGSTI